MSFYTRLGIDLIAGAGQDVKVKVSITDTSSEYLQDKVTATSGKVTITKVSDVGVETLDLDVDEAAVDHDALLNFVAAEHRAQNDSVTTSTTLWSSSKTQTVIDTKVTGLGTVVDNRLVRTDGTTGLLAQQTGITVDDSDNMSGVADLTVSGTISGSVAYDNIGTSLSATTLEDAVTELDARDSAGDIFAGSATLVDSQAVAANVTGFAFASTVRSFEAQIAVFISAGADKAEEFTIKGINKGSVWDISITSFGDDSEVNFDITAGGQITYTSGTYAGFVSGNFRFRALTTTV